MALDLPPQSEIITESDVEQKVVMPILTAEVPYGLDIPSGNIHTKANIKRFYIGKGSERKLYYPDYLIAYYGIPLLIIEAKKPGEDLAEAFREARLYANELNSEYSTNSNPLKKVICTDGLNFLIGYFDQHKEVMKFSLYELGQYSQKLKDLQDFCSNDTLSIMAADWERLHNVNRYFKPRRMLGSVSVQHEEIGHNSFGATVTSELSHIFNPSTVEDRKRIAISGYIPSLRRERYPDPIDRVIRATKAPAQIYAKTFENTSKPYELTKSISSGRELQHQVILIVGGVGVGKTTFIDHLQYVALPQKTRESTLWIRIDMNPAPVTSGEIYDWLRRNIITGCEKNYPDIDFDATSTIKALYSVEINKFRKRRGGLLSEDKYNEALFDFIGEIEKDLHKTANAYLRYCGNERGLLPILVLDNCDKRNRDEQLLMFEVAQWAREEFRCLVILPLRDETYDNYRHQPPLDTALKDLVFRIEPPLFQDVIVRRIQLALNEIAKNDEKNSRFSLPNGMSVDYPASDKAYFLRSILTAIFHYDRQVRRIILGLSGRSIRRALEIFVEFCTSGHFGENYIFQIKQTKGEFVPPLHVIMRVLLRGNRRFYDSDFAYVKNIFSLNEKDKCPTYFIRLIILRWLKERFQMKGPTSFKGYFPIREIASEFEKFGISEDVVLREAEYLAKGSCIITEDFRDTGITIEHTVKLAPAGFVHLDLLSSVDVLAAISEDTWFDDENTAKGIRDKIITMEGHFHLSTVLFNAKILIEELNKKRIEDSKQIKAVFSNTKYDSLTDLSEINLRVEDFKKNNVEPEWMSFEERHPLGSKLEGIIVNIAHDIGIFVEFEPGIRGLLRKSKIPFPMSVDSFSNGSTIDVEIVQIDLIRKKIKLGWVNQQ